MGVALPQPIQFGKYTLFERIGRGGMADVFKARVQGPGGFERIFVVKRILPHLSDDPTFTRMFIDEAKLSARLSHPNIVQVFELGSVDGEYFISMEYVRGRDLAETMRTLWARIGPPRPELVAYVGREMSRALAYAHELTAEDGTPLGMIHRDISPSNVMLSYDGAVKILDFGIAKALGPDQREETGTQRGTLKGKFAYMAPEQTQGSDVDRRIDIFATGIVLHEVLTGRRLFKGENDLQTVERVRQCDVPPPSLQNPLCPPELDAIVMRALSRHREDRFQSANDMADALDDVVHAARFQPTHLAQLMRDLFPGEAGPDARSVTGSARINQALTSTSSRPFSTAVRSPTIPPVALTASALRVGPPADLSAFPPPRPKPLWRRGSVWASAALLGAAFVAGMFWMRAAPRTAQSAGPAPERSRTQVLPMTVTSIPEGAEVFIDGTDQRLGKTPFRHTFELRDDRAVMVVFRLKGYEEMRKEVRASWPGMAALRPLPERRPRAAAVEAAPAPAEAPAPAAAPAATPSKPSTTSSRAARESSRRRGSSSAIKRPTASKPNDLVDPF